MYTYLSFVFNTKSDKENEHKKVGFYAFYLFRFILRSVIVARLLISKELSKQTEEERMKTEQKTTVLEVA